MKASAPATLQPEDASPHTRSGRRESPDKAVVAALAARIKRLRTEADLTLEQLAVRSGVSRAMLSKVERGEKSPTLALVARIAQGFDISLSTLLGAQPDMSDVTVIRAANAISFTDPITGFERRVLSPTHLDNSVELVLHRIPGGGSSGLLAPYKVPTEKYLVVHEGRLTVYMEDKSYVLGTGDSLYFTVKAPYRFENEGRTPCAYYMVIVRKGVTATGNGAVRGHNAS